MLVKLLKDIVGSIAGQGSDKIVDLLYNKKNVNEFLIAKNLNMNINQARNILYKLSEKGLVSFIRKKDKKNGGWYTYFWTLDVYKSLLFLKNSMIAEVKLLEDQIQSRQTKRYYYSPGADIEYSEEKALEYGFICPETGEVMELKDNSPEIGLMEERVKKLTSDLNVVDDELSKIEKKDQASKKRRIRAEEKKKAAERALKRKATQKKKELAKGAQKSEGKKESKGKTKAVKSAKKSVKGSSKKTATPKSAKSSKSVKKKPSSSKRASK